MALPKHRTPPSRQGGRRSHHAITPPQLVRDRSGRYRVNHTAGPERDRKGRPVEPTAP